MNVLLYWYENNKRPLPWRETNDPYAILLSEFILQQTRVNQGMKYYYSFLHEYPQLRSLANAPLDDIMKLWQGLGYYSRARNLWLTCREIEFDRKGFFPNTFTELKKLKGVGDYTAAAIASIAFGEVVPVLDGNVYRVLARFYAESEPIDTGKGKKLFTKLAREFLDSKSPGTHNQAIMELGAMVCTPFSPKCSECPLFKDCLCGKNGNWAGFPVKSLKTKQRNRFFYYYIIKVSGKIIIRKRTQKDIWYGLYEFPLIEKHIGDEDATSMFCELDFHINGEYTITSISKQVKHVLSHQIIYARFIHIEVDSIALNMEYELAEADTLENFAFPRLITRYLEKNIITNSF